MKTQRILLGGVVGTVVAMGLGGCIVEERRPYYYHHHTEVVYQPVPVYQTAPQPVYGGTTVPGTPGAPGTVTELPAPGAVTVPGTPTLGAPVATTDVPPAPAIPVPPATGVDQPAPTVVEEGSMMGTVVVAPVAVDQYVFVGGEWYYWHPDMRVWVHAHPPRGWYPAGNVHVYHTWAEHPMYRVEVRH